MQWAGQNRIGKKVENILLLVFNEENILYLLSLECHSTSQVRYLDTTVYINDFIGASPAANVRFPRVRVETLGLTLTLIYAMGTV